MALDKTQLKEAIKKLSRSAQDTGSSEVQVSILTEKINILTEHFKKHKKDYHSRRGLLKMVSRRKKLLSYIKKSSPEAYHNTIDQLSLRN